MKFPIALLALFSSAAASPIRMRTPERVLAEAERHELRELSGEKVHAERELAESMSMSVSMSMDDSTSDDPTSDDPASDDVTGSAAGVSVGVAAGAAVLGAIALL